MGYWIDRIGVRDVIRHDNGKVEYATDWKFCIERRNEFDPPHLVVYGDADTICEIAIAEKDGHELTITRRRGKLIAAAPELLAMLKECCTDLDGAIKRLPSGFSDHVDYENCIRLLNRVKAAISKAEGR